jgi:phosphoglycerate dehydrogenase-like enzyme
VRVLVPDQAERRLLEPLPDDVEMMVVQDGRRAVDGEWLVADPLLPGIRELPAAMPSLRVVQAISAGVDWLLPYVPAGVTVCDAAGVHDIPVAEWCVGAILAGLKRFGECRDRQRAPSAPPPPPPRDLAGARVLIVGHGSIGGALAARLEPFGAEIHGVARHARPGVSTTDDLPALLPTADVVVLLLPLTPETTGMAGADFLAALPDGALVINAGRGALLDTDALVRELARGRLRAVLDVTDPEPLPPDHPLRRAPNALVTPHIAGRSPHFLARAYRLVRDQLEREASGRPLRNVVGAGY